MSNSEFIFTSFFQSASWVQNDEVLIHKKSKGRRYMFTESSNRMNRIVSVSLAFIAILGAVAPPAYAQEQAQWADSFVDFPSINKHLIADWRSLFEIMQMLKTR